MNLIRNMIIPVAKSVHAIVILATVSGAVLAVSCTSMGPTVAGMTMGFAQDVISAATKNFTGGYGNDVEKLLAVIATDYYEEKKDKERRRDNNDPYANDTTNDSYDDPYANDTKNDSYDDPYANDTKNDSYDDPYANDTKNDSYDDPYANDTTNDSYNDPYANDTANDSYNDPYANDTTNNNRNNDGRRSGLIKLDVALLAQRRDEYDGSVRLAPITDGEVLRDGRGNPSAGDKLKVFFSANCNCYVYVIGIDATGYVTQIYPETNRPAGMPVEAGRQYLMPEQNSWWGLDEYRGTETIYFIASYRRRTDIEQTIIRLAQQPREISNNYQAVSRAAVIPDTRGLVKVMDASPARVTFNGNNTQSFTPSAFGSTVSDADLVITRWFEHR